MVQKKNHSFLGWADTTPWRTTMLRILASFSLLAATAAFSSHPIARTTRALSPSTSLGLIPESTEVLAKVRRDGDIGEFVKVAIVTLTLRGG